MAKINQEWRSILRQVKIQELRREIIDVESFFKEALKRKDQVIHRLIAHIESTEDMYANLQQSHMENITQIVGGFCLIHGLIELLGTPFKKNYEHNHHLNT